MSTRTTHSTVRFDSAFILAGLEAPLPAGEYRIDLDEQLLEAVSRLVWRRIATFIHLPAIGTESPTRQMLQIDPADLDTALEKDRKLI